MNNCVEGILFTVDKIEQKILPSNTRNEKWLIFRYRETEHMQKHTYVCLQGK